MRTLNYKALLKYEGNLSGKIRLTGLSLLILFQSKLTISQIFR